jgi:hypothetical protein
MRGRNWIATALLLGAFALLAALWLSPAAWAADNAAADAAEPLEPPAPAGPFLPPLGPTPLPPAPGPLWRSDATPTATPTPTPDAPDEHRAPPVPTLLTVPPASTRRQPAGLPLANGDPLDDAGDEHGDGGAVTSTPLGASPVVVSPADGRLGPSRPPGGQPLGAVIATVTPSPAPTEAPAAPPAAGGHGLGSREAWLVERANRALGALADEVVRLVEWIVVLK